jgi:glycosyltransferase involved in cell wall biosynthesis
MKDSNMMKVSAIINTFNRYKPLQKAIESVQNQTHSNIEIIVVNDKSTQKEYYQAKRPEGVIWIDAEKSSREVFGFPSLGYSRNIGIFHATGDYIAVLDDDDIWMPEKIATQLSAMIKRECKMSCTEGYMGDSSYNQNKRYPLYYKEYYSNFCRDFFNEYAGSWKGVLPDIFDFELIQKHNFIIHSSVMFEKKLLDKTGLYKENICLNSKNSLQEDWELWLRILKYTNCLYIHQPLIYYDGRLSENLWYKRMSKKINKFFIKS